MSLLGGNSTEAMALDACLEALRSRPCAVIVDLDGTISPIAAEPELARVLPGCRAALGRLAAHLDLVGVLSGRRPREARNIVGIDAVDYWGVHGMVRLSGDTECTVIEAMPFLGVLDSVRTAVESRGLWDGMLVEAKGPSLAIHYRNTASPSNARSWLLTVLRPLAIEHRLDILEGRMVLELRPPTLGKGWCLANLVKERGLRSLAYFGDDRTDAEVFQAMKRWERTGPDRHGVAIAVTNPEVPPDWAVDADYSVDGVDAVERLLGGIAAEFAG